MNHHLQALKIVGRLEREPDDNLNKKLFDLKTKYNISDEDMITMNACISLVTKRKILG